jgi:hypothetical protein
MFKKIVVPAAKVVCRFAIELPAAAVALVAVIDATTDSTGK